MADPRLPLAELHLHMYGTIRAEDYLERLGAREVLFEHPEAFANINTRDDLAAVAARGPRHDR